MLSKLSVCPLASFILIMVIIINVVDIYLVGVHFTILVTNLLISIFFVWLANKTCDKYHWVSWLISIYFAICIIGAITILTNPKILNEKGFEETKALAKEAGRVKVE